MNEVTAKPTATENTGHSAGEARGVNELLFGLNSRPPIPQAVLAALAHLLAIVAGIATAPLLIARGLNLDVPTTAYVIGAAFVVSGIATLIQVVRIGAIGSGLLSIQGTSFSFVGVLVYAASLLDGAALTDAQRLGILLGSGTVGGLLTIVAGVYIQRLARVITVNVTGVTIFMLGATLVLSAWQNFQWSLASTRIAGEDTQQTLWVWLQAGIVIGVIAWLASRRSAWLRLLSICVGLAAGVLVALFTTGLDDTSVAPAAGLLIPRWQPFELAVQAGVVLVLLPIFLVSMMESVGDITATSLLSRCEVSGPSYWRRIRGGIVAGGINSILAALAGTFPITTFSQNNAVIQLTGVASRVVGVMVAALLILLGLLPQFVALFQLIPGGVLHAVSGLLFAMIAWAGLRLLRLPASASSGLRSRGMDMLLGCTAAAMGLSFVPELLSSAGIELPTYLSILLNFPVATAAVLAMIWEGLAGPEPEQAIGGSDTHAD